MNFDKVYMQNIYPNGCHGSIIIIFMTTYILFSYNICISITLGRLNAAVALGVFVPIGLILILIAASVFGILLFMKYKKTMNKSV